MYEPKAYDVTSDEAAADPARVRGARAAGAVPRGASDAGAAPGAGGDPTVLYVRQPRTWAAPFLHLPIVRPDGLRSAAHIGVRVHRYGWPRNSETVIPWLPRLQAVVMERFTHLCDRCTVYFVQAGNSRMTTGARPARVQSTWSTPSVTIAATSASVGR